MIHQEINVWIVCPNSLAKEGLRRILSEDPFKVCNSFDDAGALCESAGGLAMLGDGEIILLGGTSGDIRRQVSLLGDRSHACKLVLLADHFDFDTMIEAFRAGVDGYIISDIQCQSLIESLKLVASGEKVLPSQLIKHLPLRSAMANAKVHDGFELLESLSEREVETLRCLVMGYPNKVIAYRLDISEATVKVHVKAILRKLGVQNRTQAAIWAVNNGIDADAACATIAGHQRNDAAEIDDFEFEPMSVEA